VTELGKTISGAISLSFGLDKESIRDNYLQPEPVALLGGFKYVSTDVQGAEDTEKEVWGIGEHTGGYMYCSHHPNGILMATTDFGLLMILSQDCPSLQVCFHFSVVFNSISTYPLQTLDAVAKGWMDRCTCPGERFRD
jgi:hypothetical protein